MKRWISLSLFALLLIAIAVAQKPAFVAPPGANGTIGTNGATGATGPTGSTAVAANINAQTGTSYTLVSGDNGKVITMSNASAITLTVPGGLGSGFNCLVVQLAAGQVTPTASSTTINQRQSLTKTAGQYAVISLLAYTADTFTMGGDLQ